MIDSVSRICGALTAALVLLLMSLMVYEVMMRYAFDAPTMWSYDVSTMTMGAIFMLSIGYTLLTDSHVRVDLFHSVIGPNAKPMVDLVGHGFFILPLLIWLTWGLWDHFLGAFMSGERTGASAWNPLVWPFRALMFVGVVVWTLQTVAEIAKSILSLMGRPIGEPDKPARTD